MANAAVNAMPMGRVYFDISDIVSYAQHHSRVSGIQRVQWNIITHLARRYGGDVIRCTFFDSRSNSMRECRADEALVGDEFDAELMLIQLGLIEYRRYLPSRMRIKEYLRRFTHNKPLRTLHKADVYLSSYFFPQRLARMGLAPAKSRPHRPRAANVRALASLQREEIFVMLGLHWDLPQVLEFARRHKDSGGDVVQLVFDLILYKFPQYANPGNAEMFTRWLNSVCDCATRFMCISESTAVDLRQFLQGRQGQWEIATVPLAHEFRRFDRQTPVPPPNERIGAVLSKPYVLCVGTIEIRKNGTSLLRAWARLKQQHGGRLPRLVFAGSKGWLMEEFNATLNVDSSLAQVIDLPSDEELACLYQNCLFTVYPSYYEGWGLPVGEAAWFGKYCVAANTSSLPEVCGELIDYADPGKLDDLVLKLGNALEKPDYVSSKARAISATPMRLWTDVAEDMLRFVLRLPHADQSLAALDQGSTSADYIRWKGWEAEQFGQPNEREIRYYRWHVRRALPHAEVPSVLEIGFGNGAFLGFCRQQGWLVQGIEQAKPLCERARHAGFTVYENLDSLPRSSSFDLIALFDVLEHIPAERVIGVVRSLATHLNRSGALLIRVPNGDSPFGRHNQHGDLTHVTTFGRSKFEQLAELCNLRITAIGEAPWNAQQLENPGFRSLRRAAVRALFIRLFGTAFYGRRVDLSSNMVVVMKHIGS